MEIFSKNHIGILFFSIVKTILFASINVNGHLYKLILTL